MAEVRSGLLRFFGQHAFAVAHDDRRFDCVGKIHPHDRTVLDEDRVLLALRDPRRVKGVWHFTHGLNQNQSMIVEILDTPEKLGCWQLQIVLQ